MVVLNYGSTNFGSAVNSAGNTYVTTLVDGGWSQQRVLTDPFGTALYPIVRSAYGSTVAMNDGQGPEAFFISAQRNWSCLIPSLGDQFVVAPDGSSDQYAPSCRTNNPYQLRYCPNLESDHGLYSLSLSQGAVAAYFWEIYWTVQVEGTAVSYRGDHTSSLKFYFNTTSRAFQFVSGEHIIKED
eukprot:gene5135-6543_t